MHFFSPSPHLHKHIRTKFLTETLFFFFFFFFFHDAYSDGNTKEPWRLEGDSRERNEKARKAYQALLTVTTRTPDNVEYLNFSREVKQLAQSRYNFTFGNSSVSTFVTAFYDAVLLYALALKESLPEKPGEVNLDGGNLTRRMWGRSFKGELLGNTVNGYACTSEDAMIVGHFDGGGDVSRHARFDAF